MMANSTTLQTFCRFFSIFCLLSVPTSAHAQKPTAATALRDIQNTYDFNPSKLSFFMFGAIGASGSTASCPAWLAAGRDLLVFNCACDAADIEDLGSGSSLPDLVAIRSSKASFTGMTR
jgi:hypothetical protein